MRPEKVEKRDAVEAYTAIGIPEEWVAPLQKLGVTTVAALAPMNPNKLFQELCGFNKRTSSALPILPTTMSKRGWPQPENKNNRYGH